MSKEWFLIFMFLILFVLAGSIFLESYLLNKIPDSVINLPNKEFHLSDERKEVTIKTINNFLLLSISITIALLIAVNYLALRVNMGYTKKLSSSFDIILIIYFVLLFFLILKMYLKFKKTPQKLTK